MKFNNIIKNLNNINIKYYDYIIISDGTHLGDCDITNWKKYAGKLMLLNIVKQ
jgi:hypothetical protein